MSPADDGSVRWAPSGGVVYGCGRAQCGCPCERAYWLAAGVSAAASFVYWPQTDLGLSSSFISAIRLPEKSPSVHRGDAAQQRIKWLAKYLPDDSVKDIAGIEISGSSWATLAWGGALRVDVGEEAVAEGVVSGDAVRWLAMLRRGRRSSRVPMTMKPALGLSYPPLEGARSVDAYRLRHRPGVAEDLSG